MTREEILCSLEAFPNIDVFEITDKTVTVYDNNTGKTSTFNINFSVNDLAEKIYISPMLPQFAKIDKSGLVSYLMKALNPSTFVTLNKIWILADETEYQLMAKEHSSEALSFASENSFGQMWPDEDVVFIDVCNIINRAESNPEQFNIHSSEDLKLFVRIETLVTTIHELRHLQLDTNIFLSEDDYPPDLAEEIMVEDFAIQTFLSNPPHGVFIGN